MLSVIIPCFNEEEIIAKNTNKILNWSKNQDFKTEILAASIRGPMHIIDCAKIGADVVTTPLKSIKGLLNHPLTDIGLEKFLDDYKKGNK